MADDILAAIAQLGTDLRREIIASRAELMARMDRLQARLDHLGDEWFVAYAQHEGIGRRVDGVRQEQSDLRDQISGLVRQVRALRDRLDALEGP